MSSPVEEAHFIVLPGGGYEVYAENEGEPIVDWLGGLGIAATVLRYPLHAQHPIPLDALRSELRRVRATGVTRVGVAGFSAGGHLAGHAALSGASTPDALVTAAAPPFFIWHTAEDPYVPVEHSYRLASALAAHDVPHALHVFSQGPHSLGLARGAGEPAAWTELAAGWLVARLDHLARGGR